MSSKQPGFKNGFIRTYLPENVYEAALNRIRWIFTEFPNVIVDISGGKDSTVILNLSLQIAEEMNRLPLKVYYCDMEVSWNAVYEHVKEVFRDPRIEPIWLQLSMPKAIINASSSYVPYFHSWDPEREADWVRPKEDIAIKDNIYGAESYYDLFDKFDHYHFPPDLGTCHIGGIRTEESPARKSGLTSYETYGGETWGNKRYCRKGEKYYTFYPIYDWSYTDVWKAIHDNNWPYCKVYDLMYQYGTPLQAMRISSVIHESSVKDLLFLQEFEPDTWERIVRRVDGANSTARLQQDFFTPKELPFMFNDWAEYRDHLLDNLIIDPERQKYFRDTFQKYERLFVPEVLPKLIKVEINQLITNEVEEIKLSMFVASNASWLKTNQARMKNAGSTQVG